MWREAVNASIQGFVGNWMRLSMLEFVAKLPEELKDKCFMIMQVHDELVFHCREEVVDIAKPYINKCMVQPYGLKLKVPLEVEIQQLKRWGGDE